MSTLKNMPTSRYRLSNGLTVLIKPVHAVPKVSIQLWYAVGSKHEVSNQRGLAHLLEHMLFKGTARFSELDITRITHTFSGNCNAFTSCDYTAYVFDFPKKHWEIGLDILSDTMRNCTFKQDLLASELKAVIQELKIYNDDYETTLLEQMMGLIFTDHPYRYPIIGSRYDLLRITSKGLFDFYNTYYAPNNATLVIVGDVSCDEALDKVKQYFSSLKSNLAIPEQKSYFEKDIVQKSLILYRDIQQPVLFVSWVIPGIQGKEEHIFDAICWILCRGKGSRLYKKLVYEENKAVEVDGFIYNFFEYGLLCIQVVPLLKEYNDQIITIIQEEIALLIATLTSSELTRASKQIVAEYSFNFETTSEQASVLGEYFLALGSIDYPFQSYEQVCNDVEKKIVTTIEQYLCTSSMHHAQLLPLEKKEKKYWNDIQDNQDKFDEQMLSSKIRTTPLEESSYTFNLALTAEKDTFSYPAYKKEVLENGLTVIWHDNPACQTVNVLFDFEVDHTYDPDDSQGLCNFVFELLSEGTKKYTALQLAQKIESRGISLAIHAGKIVARCLADDLPETLEIIHEIITNPSFEQHSIERVRKKIYSSLDDYWDTPSRFLDQLVREKIYKNHPYSKNPLGDKNSIKKITREKIIDFYNRYITPKKSRLGVVGAVDRYDIPRLVDKIFGLWAGPSMAQRIYPPIDSPTPEVVAYSIDRDQVIICFAGLSVKRFDDEYNSLFLFDQIVTGGTQGSMASRLFSLREKTGLFYTVGGSVVAHADEQPGMIFIQATVSKEDIASAQELIAKEIDDAVSSITQNELDDARNAVHYGLVDIFESNSSMAEAFLFLDRFNVGPDYFTFWGQQLANLTVDDIKKVVSKRVNMKKCITITIGRVS